MKKTLLLLLIIGSTLVGSYLLYGNEGDIPKDANLTVNNRTNIDFQNIGLYNGSWASILSDVRENKIDHSKNYYFNLKNLDDKDEWCLKAIDNSGKEYFSYVKLNPGDKLIVKDIKNGKLITNSDCEPEKNLSNFDMASLVSNWEYKIENNKIVSRFVCKYKHSTKVMGKDNKVNSSDVTSPNKSSQVFGEKGKKNLSWIEIVYN
ncbi:hypothetical protein [Lagierella massiliensis]|uniref:hypothetical protein n=1 Tax=Lagierella massiliensis TaxID=1689303 RepID=UPI0006D7BFF1|nr:hypothetical protein [Lagierella massiliensis]